MPEASHRPLGSVNASAAIVSPDAIPGSSSPSCASDPVFMIAFAASATVEKYGAHNSTRPISSSTMPSSTNVNPWPPCASGMCRLCRPSSCAICFQTASSYPSVVSMRRRTSDEGDLASMNLRTASRSCSCSSENAKFIVSPSGSRLTREPEHPLADDVALDLARSCVDGLGPARHEDAMQVAELVVPAGLPLDDERVGAEHVHRQLTELAMPRRPVHLADARLRPEHALLHEAREHPHAVVLHDLDADVRVGEPLANRLVGGRAVLVRDVDEIGQLALERQLLRQECRPALEAQRRHRDLPAVVHLADDVLLVGTGVVEEDLVELGRARHLLERPCRDAVLLHRDEQVRDPLVGGRLGIGAHDCEAPVGPVGERRPDLLPVDHPLVTVEHGAGLDVREVGTGVRLRVALAPQLLGGLDLGQEALLLLIGPVRDQRRREQPLTEEADAGRRVRLGVLLVEDDLLGEARGTPAVLLRPPETDPAVAAEHALPLDAHVPVALVGRSAAAPDLREVAHEVVGEPGAHLVAERGLRGRVRRSEEHTSELQSHHDLVCRLLLEKKKKKKKSSIYNKKKKTKQKNKKKKKKK